MIKNLDTGEFRNQLLQLIPSGVGVYDVTGSTVKKEYLNDGYFQMIGAGRDVRHQYDGTNTVNAIHKDDISGLLAETKAAMQENRMLEYRLRILDGNGSYKWFAIRANHVPVNADTERFYASYYDIDNLVRTQETIRSNKLMINDMLKYSDIVHFTYYPDKKQYEIIVVPENLKGIPTAMEDFPEAFIKYTDLSPADAEKYREMVRKIDSGQQEAECTVRTLLLGKRSWYRVHLWNFLDSGGHSLKAVGNAVDISKFKEAEKIFDDEKLRMKSLQSGILAASFFNVSGDYSIELNNDSNLCYLDPKDKAMYDEAIEADPEIAHQNPSTLKVLLAAAEQIPDKNQRRNFMVTCSHAGMMKLYSSGKHEVNLEYRRWTGRGLIWVLTRVVLMPDPETGDIVAFYYTSDINDRVIYQKITGKILSQNFESVAYYDINSKKMYLKAFENQDSFTFKPVDYNEAIEYAVKKYVVSAETQDIYEKYLLKNVLAALEKEAVYSIYYTGNETDDNLPSHPKKRMKCDIFYLDSNNDIVVFLQTNATAIYEQEREVREKLEAAMQASEIANKAKTDFISRISHDIRTPIGIITSMTDFAFSDIRDEEKLKSDLSKIKSADEFLLSLINDVLDISKIDSGKMALNPQPYDFDEYSKNIKNMLDSMCSEKGLKYSISGQKNHGVIVADKTRINQLILNLLSNAVKYTPAGGTVSYKSLSTDVEDNKIRYCFEISDTGIGISDEFQKVMFDPFTQEYDNASRPKGLSGTGLGLSIVKKIVDLMGGTISVRSKLGKGTTIRCEILFPDALRDPRYKYAIKTNPVSVQSRKALFGKVLVAEDNSVNTEIAVRILTSFGLTTVCAENGLKAVEIFEKSFENEFCAILMDIQMPVMNGFEAAKKIRSLSRSDSEKIPIIAMTANAFDEDVQASLSAGMNAHASKPIDVNKLYNILDSLIS